MPCHMSWSFFDCYHLPLRTSLTPQFAVQNCFVLVGTMIDIHHLAGQPSAFTSSFAPGLKKSMAGIYYLPFQQVRQCQPWHHL